MFLPPILRLTSPVTGRVPPGTCYSSISMQCIRARARIMYENVGRVSVKTLPLVELGGLL